LPNAIEQQLLALHQSTAMTLPDIADACLPASIKHHQHKAEDAAVPRHHTVMIKSALLLLLPQQAAAAAAVQGCPYKRRSRLARIIFLGAIVTR
jgi:hypothetical protein